MSAGVAALVAWAGVSLIVLSDGRRGLAAGLGLLTIALSLLAWQSSGVIEAAVLLVAGALATARRLRSGPPGWVFVPAGSTPRVILCAGAALLALWVSASLTTGSDAALRFGALTVIGLAGARILASDDSAALMTAVAALALALAVAPAMQGTSPGIAQFVAAGVVAAGSAWLPRTRADAA